VTLSDNRASGDVFTDSYTSATFNNKGVGTGKTVSVTGISIAGADAGNYTFNTTASTSADITARALTVSATGIDTPSHATTPPRPTPHPPRQPRLGRWLHRFLHERHVREKERGHRQVGVGERHLHLGRGRGQLHLQHHRQRHRQHHDQGAGGDSEQRPEQGLW